MTEPENNQVVLAGMLAVSAALAAHNRSVSTVLVTPKLNPRRRAFLKRLTTGSCRIRTVSADKIEQHTSGGSHGGVVALAEPRCYQQFGDLIEGTKNPLLLMLDGIEDPYSLGWAIRSAWAAGVGGLVLRERDWGSSESVVCRASAGAFDRMPIALASDPFEAAEFYKQAGLALAITDQADQALSLFDAPLAQPLFIFIGGERRGVQRRFRDQADFVIEIPYGRKFKAALGAASAATVVAFEAMRQRRQGGGTG